GFANQAVVMLQQPNGNLVVGGTSRDPFQGPALLVRLQPDGCLDPGFGDGGIANLPGDGGAAFAIALQAGGKSVGGGDHHKRGTGGASAGGTVGRVNADGTLDASFGTGGSTTFPVPQDAAAVTAIQLDGDGRIRIAGTANFLRGEVFTARLDATGVLD